MTITMSGLPAPVGSETLTMAGAMDFAGPQGTMTGSMQLAGRSETLTVVADGSTDYEQVPAQVIQELGGKQWLRIDTTSASGVPGIAGAGSLSSGGSFDPTQGLDMLDALVGKPAVVGHGEIRGVATTEYAGTVSLARQLQRLPAAARAAALQQEEKYGLQDSVPFKAWLDSNGRLRQFSMTETMEHAPGASGATHEVVVAITMDYYDFGVPVSVTVPPASETESFSAYQAQLGRGGAGVAGAGAG